jgi:hypothetical protein
MEELLYKNKGVFKIIGDWDWQAKLLLKEKFGQLTLSDLKFKSGKENDLLTRLGIRLNKKPLEIIKILKKLRLY